MNSNTITRGVVCTSNLVLRAFGKKADWLEDFIGQTVLIPRLCDLTNTFCTGPPEGGLRDAVRGAPEQSLGLRVVGKKKIGLVIS